VHRALPLKVAWGNLTHGNNWRIIETPAWPLTRRLHKVEGLLVSVVLLLLLFLCIINFIGDECHDENNENAHPVLVSPLIDVTERIAGTRFGLGNQAWN